MRESTYLLAAPLSLSLSISLSLILSFNTLKLNFPFALPLWPKSLWSANKSQIQIKWRKEWNIFIS